MQLREGRESQSKRKGNFGPGTSKRRASGALASARERLDARLLGRCFAALSAGIQASRARTTDQTTTDDAVADIDVEGYHGGALELRYVLATPLSDHHVPIILPDPPSPSPRGDTWQMGIGAG